MKYCFSTLRLSLILVIATIFLVASCRKETASVTRQTLSNNKLAILYSEENKIRINQAITVYDSTLTTDTVGIAITPPGVYYQWEVLPTHGCDTIWGERNKGIVSFVFHCSGTYMLTAKIYDSLTRNLIGATDTLAINVTSDTLYPTQQIKADDTLNIRSFISKSYHDTTLPPDEVLISLMLSSTKHYNSYEPDMNFEYISNISTNNYAYVVKDVKMNFFPFAHGPYEATTIIWAQLNLNGLKYEIPANLSITWLGITYTGTVILEDENHYKINWDNSGAVKIR